VSCIEVFKNSCIETSLYELGGEYLVVSNTGEQAEAVGLARFSDYFSLSISTITSFQSTSLFEASTCCVAGGSTVAVLKPAYILVVNKSLLTVSIHFLDANRFDLLGALLSSSSANVAARSVIPIPDYY